MGVRSVFAVLLFLCVLCLAQTKTSCAAEQVCRTIDGSFNAELESFDADAFTFNDGTSRPVAANDLITWGNLTDSSDGTQVLLSDGSVVVASDVALDGEELIVQANLFGEPEGFSIAGTSRIPVSGVRAVIFRVPLRPADRDALFAKLQSVTGFEDQLWLANGDILKGTLSKLERDKSSGKPGPLSLAIKTTAGDIEIQPDDPQGKLLEKVQALIFNPALLRKVDGDIPSTLIGLSDGSRLFAKQVESSGEQATFTLAAGVKLPSHPDENIWRRINSLQRFGSGVTWLSDLSPADFRHTPLVGRKWPLGEDENVAGGKLRANGAVYLKGLGMHAAARTVYVLDQPYSRFEAELAIDDIAGDAGSVMFLVAHDAGGKFNVVYKSPIICGGDEPTDLSLDITGARRLVLFVEPADHGDVMDRANWLNARLIPG